MKLLWEYPLPQSDLPRDYEYEGPILAHGGLVYFAGYAPPNRHWHPVRLYRIDQETGGAHESDFLVGHPPLPGNWSLSLTGDRILLNAGWFIECTGTPHGLGALVQGAMVPEKLAQRPEPLVSGHRLYFTNDKTETLFCFDRGGDRVIWTQPLGGHKYYRVGAPLWFGEQLACFGRNALLILDPDIGDVVDELRSRASTSCSARSRAATIC